MNAFAERFAGMSEDDLQRGAAGVANLVPEARTALRLEMERRDLPTDGIDWTEQPQPAPDEPPKSSGSFRRFAKHLGIYIACDLVYIVVLGFGMAAAGMGDRYTEPFLTLMIDSYWKAAIALAVVTSKWIIPKKIKTVWIIGAIGPAVLILLMFGYAAMQSH